jgi:hypothetical protein
MDRPAFRAVADGLEYCVRVVWADGAEAHIRHFSAIQDAQRWVDRESSAWLLARENRSRAQPQVGNAMAIQQPFRTRVLKMPA